MMRSMYSAVSGLRVHQTKMDVIGNNIANVNTVGFKKGQVNFKEIFSQTVRGAGAPQDGKGGTNPQQIGLGVDVGSINTVHTKGPNQRTDNPTDVMIDGEGFFVVSDDTNFENRYYTRAGDFSLDKQGNLVTSDGYKVLGYDADQDGNITSEISNIRINRSETNAPTSTTGIKFESNLDSRASSDEVYSTNTEIKDSLGNSYVVEFEMQKLNENDDKSEWNITLKEIRNKADESKITVKEPTKEIKISFENNGKLSDDSNKDFVIKFDDLKRVGFGEYDKEAKTFGNEIKVDLSSLTQYANDTTAKPKSLDGNTSGNIEGFAISPFGVVEGIFTNGSRKALGQLLVSKFDNPMGLQKLGNNFFIDTRNSGEPQLGKGNTGGFGAINSGSLEMSNVDLAMEFTEMITTQRGFQANSRIITASDEMLQELVNMKR